MSLGLIGDICDVYADDIVMFARPELELVQCTRKVLKRLQRHDLYGTVVK